MRSVVISAVAAVAVATVLSAQTVTYRFSGWCLSYERGSLPPNVEDITFAGALPQFSLPVNTDAKQISIRVGFKKGDARNRPGLIRGNTACRRVNAEHGLIRLEDNDEDKCRLSPVSTQFEAASDDEPDAAISIYCSNNPAVSTCRIFDLYPTGWEATIRAPKAEMRNWSRATKAVRDFFEANLIDCGATE